MVFGAIDMKSQEYYTNLNEVFKAIKYKQKEYNFLITDCFCSINNSIDNLINDEGYLFISGDLLTKIIEEEEIQWIWGVFSAFSKNIPLDEILKYKLPYADMNEDLWKLPLKLENPLATFEIVAFDGSLTLIYSKEKDIIDNFFNYFKESETLESYIKRNSKLAGE